LSQVVSRDGSEEEEVEVGRRNLLPVIEGADPSVVSPPALLANSVTSSLKRPAFVFDLGDRDDLDDGDGDGDDYASPLPISILSSPSPRHHSKARRVTPTTGILAPLETICASIDGCLAPGKFLDDIIVNMAAARFATARIGVIDSLSLESTHGPRLMARAAKQHDTLLFPVCDRVAQHWRLYVWRSPATLDVYDPCQGLQDTTTDAVKHLFGMASEGLEVQVTHPAVSLPCSLNDKYTYMHSVLNNRTTTIAASL
jgi:hypothetical protein